MDLSCRPAILSALLGLLTTFYRIVTMRERKQIGRGDSATHQVSRDKGAALRPTEEERRYLLRGPKEPGGKLPIFICHGRKMSRQTIAAGIAHGWAEPWFNNPIKPDCLVCKLTPAGLPRVGSKFSDRVRPANASLMIVAQSDQVFT
jgi:hypothetical protein